MQHGMDGALGGNPDIAGQAADQQLAYLAGAPMGFAAFEADDGSFELLRQLIGVTHRPPRPVGKGCEAVLRVAVEDFVTGFARDGVRYDLSPMCRVAQKLSHCFGFVILNQTLGMP
jgi:hypothetical protein